MHIRTVRTLIIATFIGASISTLSWVFFLGPSVSKVEETVAPVLSAKPAPQLPSFEITALQVRDNTRQIISCEEQVCHPLPAQPSGDESAVTDGKSWYHYQAVEDKNNIARLQLKRSWIDSDKSDLIIEETDLVEPRGLFISPDNQKIAFWLDNTSREDKAGLTELWIYNSSENGTKLIAEKIKKEGVLTEPRWNRTSTHIYFLGETVINSKKTDTVHVASIHTPSLSIPFSNINWEDKHSIVEGNAIDISRMGQAIAYVETKLYKNVLHIQKGATPDSQTRINGQVAYLGWLTDDALLYVVQTDHTFTFWKLSNGTHRHIAKYQGVFQSARIDSQGKYLIFNTKHDNSVNRTLALDINSGHIEAQGSLPDNDGDTYLIHFELKESPKIAGAIDQIDDDLIAGFIDKHLSEISQDEAQRQRLIVTDQPNTVFVDYTSSDNKRSRILLGIQDVVHVEWTIIARYHEQSGEWVRTQGGGLSEPNPLRLYEWEEGLKQWVFKEDYNSVNNKPVN